MANIVLDLDDTLMTSAPYFLEALNKLTGLSHSPQTLWSYDLARIYGLTADQVQECFREQKVLQKLEWTGDQEIWNSHVWRWITQDHNIIYCTARGWHPYAEAITSMHVARAGEMPCDIVVVPHGQSKMAALKEEGIVPHVFVDDLYVNVVEASQAGARSILFGQPWNHMNVWGNRVLSQQELVGAIDAALYERTG